MTWIESVSRVSKGWVRSDHEIDLFCCRGKADRPLAVITAGIHGDEYEGPAAIGEIVAALDPERMEGSVIAIPVANPYAFQAGRRTTPEDDLNLARTFPGDPSGSVTQRLAAHLFGPVSGADFLIDLHSGGVEYLFHPLAGFYGPPEDGNASYQAARRMGLPVLWQLPETAGVLSREAWRRGITAVGTEYLGAGQLSLQGANAYLEGVLSCLAFWGILPERQPIAPGGERLGGDWQLARSTGIFHACLSIGARVAAGQEIAQIQDIKGEVVERFVAQADGMLLAIRSKAYIRKGDWGVLVATNV
ncbi:MAG TPA: succinylglutamate desuccinylase/aspartoacylase family protein [Bryobacteraceae bacterium]|nr:succinylglutamate desuccinylase/aspartoacylase family protein [Bryobacteraceae bacterium]